MSRGARGASSISYAQVVAEAPHQFHDFMEEIRDGQIEVGFVHKGLDDLLAKLDTLVNRLVIALVVVGGLIGSSLIGIFAKDGPHLLGVNVLSIGGFLALGRARRVAHVGRRALRTPVGLENLAEAAADDRRRCVA